MAHLNRSIEDEIADKYEQCRRKFHPGYVVGNKHDRDWSKVAQLVRQIDADPRLFVEAQFEMGAVNGNQKFPFPSQIHGSKAQSFYEEYMSKFRSKAVELVACQFRYLTNFVNRCGFTIDEAISSPLRPFRPFFRALVCSEETLPEILEQWGSAAARELERDRDLLTYLNEQYGYRTQQIVRQNLPGEASSERSAIPPPTPLVSEWENFPRRF